jgi:hypothetical protein
LFLVVFSSKVVDFQSRIYGGFARIPFLDALALSPRRLLKNHAEPPMQELTVDG